MLIIWRTSAEHKSICHKCNKLKTMRYCDLHAFFYLGTICRFSWNGGFVSHWRFHDNRNMNTSADVSKFKIVPVHSKCWILLKPVLGGVNGSLHLTVPSMNRLNQTEPATFSIKPCWAFFRVSYFLYSITWNQINITLWIA
jgi:hypothetical protein